MRFKKLILSIFIISILFSSCGNKNTQLYRQYIRQFYESINLFNRINENNYMKFCLSTEENLIKHLKWYNYAQKLKLNEENLVYYIDSLQSVVDSSVLSDILNYKVANSEEFKHKIKLKPDDIIKLKQKIADFKNLTLSVIPNNDDSKLFINHINSRLSTDSLFYVNTFNSKSVSTLEYVASLLKLKLTITLVYYNLLKFLDYNTGCSDRFIPIYTVIVPNSQILPVGVPYRAEIYNGVRDTTKDFNYEIDGKIYKANECKSFYKHKITEAPGEYTKTGNFTSYSICTGKTLKIPFKIEYVVMEKK